MEARRCEGRSATSAKRGQKSVVKRREIGGNRKNRENAGLALSVETLDERATVALDRLFSAGNAKKTRSTRRRKPEFVERFASKNDVCRKINLKRRFQIFPFDRPTFRETGAGVAGRRGRGTFRRVDCGVRFGIEAGAHRRDGVKEPAVSGEVRARAAEVDAAFVVNVARRVVKEHFDRQIRTPDAGRRHRRPREIPTPAAGPLPFGDDFFERSARRRLVDSVERREHSKDADQVRMFPIPLFERVEPFGGVNENAVFLRERREILANFVPTRDPILPEPFAPTVRRVETPTPIREVENAVFRRSLFARRHVRRQMVNAVGVANRVIGHMLGGFFDNLRPF